MTKIVVLLLCFVCFLAGCGDFYAPAGMAYWPTPAVQSSYPDSINFYDQWGYQGTGTFDSSGNMYFYPSYNYPNYGGQGSAQILPPLR